MTHTPPQPDEAGATCKDSLHVGTPQPKSGVNDDDVERAARAIYEIEPFYMPTGEARDGIQIARKFDYSDAPASTQIRAQQLARAALQSISGAEGWREIESAPKDGTKILVWTVHDEIELTEWYELKHKVYRKVEGSDLFHEEMETFATGWNGNIPVLWQPLPPPPSPATEMHKLSQGEGQ